MKKNDNQYMKNDSRNKTGSIAKIAIPSFFRRLFDYRIPKHIDSNTLKIGMRVQVSFNNKVLVGILMDISDKTDVPKHKIKPLIAVLDEKPIISETVFELCEWTCRYYHHGLGEVLFNALPARLRRLNDIRKKQPKTKNDDTETIRLQPEPKSKEKTIHPNEAQQAAIDVINQQLNHYQPYLLNGITGSGKTEVYLRVIEQVLKQKQQALILIPEISLTPQTVSRFQHRFPNENVATLHSGLTPNARLQTWQQTQSGEVNMVIGTRSAIFTPFQQLGVIIIDEEHDLSFKQQDKIRYSARDLAVVRARLENIPLILGSATPSLETLHNAELNRYQTLLLPERVGKAIHPTFQLIDIRGQPLKHGISNALLEAISHHLDLNNQVLLFLNRRGYAPTLMCHQCGWIAKCTRCDVNLTLHKQSQQLRCHHCDSIKAIPKTCPNCHHKALQNIGAGTERLEYMLQKQFPEVMITRIDRDTTRKKDDFEALTQKIHDHPKQILIGTQMLTKGHHFPNVTLIGIINMDAGFFSADFRMTERSAQLLIQVAGRAGRAEKNGEVLIQTHYPQHPMLLQLIQKGYVHFATSILKERKSSRLPPFTYFALFRAEANKQDSVEEFLNQVKQIGIEIANAEYAQLLGPIPSPMPKCKGRFRSQLLVYCKNRAARQALLDNLMKEIPGLTATNRVRWSIDVDPMEMG